MGNTQSSEFSHGHDYERKAPTKLVKQRNDANADDMRFFSSSSTPGLILAGGHPARRYTMPAGNSPSIASFDHSVPLPTRENSSTALNLLSAGREPLSDAGSRRESMTEEKQRKDRSRRSIFRSKSSCAETSRRSKPERRNTVMATSAPPLPPIEGQGVALPSNRMSIFAGPNDSPYIEEAASDNWHISDNRTSWHYDLKTYDAKRLLNLVQDTRDPSRYEEGSVGVSAAVSEQRFSVVSETTWKSSHPAQPTENSHLPRVNSDLSMYTPVRRRSIIQTPGVATRGNSSRSPSVHNRYSHPPTPSNLSRQPSFEYESRVKSMPTALIQLPDVPPLPHTRNLDEPLGLVTPCEGDYQTIGAFKLGTLRITNGCASPISASPEPDEKHMINPPAPPSPQPQTGASYFIQNFANFGPGTGEKNPEPERRPTTQVNTQLDTPAFQPTRNHLAEIHSLAVTILPTSPNSHWLQTTSRTNAVEDNLFDDDVQPELSTVEKLDLRLDPNAKREYKREDMAQGSRGISRSDSGFVSSPNSDYPPPQKALSKTDSGYSSNISLRSLRDRPSKTYAEGDRSWSVALRRMSSAGSAVEAPMLDLKLDLTKDAQNHDMIFEPLRSPPPPSPPPKDFPVASLVVRGKNNEATHLETGQQTANTSSKQDTGEVKRDTTYSNTSSRTWQVVPVPAESPSSPHSATSENSGSALSIGSSPVRPGRLQRFLSIGSSSRSRALTAHATHAAEETDIPPVPKQMRRNLRTHSGLFPLTTKRLAIRPQRSRDTLKTIISVGSLEVHAGAKDPLPHIPLSYSTNSGTLDSPQGTGLDRRNTLAPSSLGKVTLAEPDTAGETELNAPKPTRTRSIPGTPLPRHGESVNKTLVSQLHKKDIESPVDGIPPIDFDNLGYTPLDTNLGYTYIDGGAKTTMDEGRMQGFLSSSTASRAKSLTSQVERSWSIKNWASPSPTLSSFGPMDPCVPHSPASIPSPLVPEIIRKKKNGTPPPVSMRTRNHANLRVPQLLRANSTPPVQVQSDEVASSSSPQALNHEVLRQQNSTCGREKQQQLGVGTEAPLLPSNPLPTNYFSKSMTPDWPIKTDHGSLNKRRMSIGQLNNSDTFIGELPSTDHNSQRPVTSGSGTKSRSASSHRPGAKPSFSQDFAFQIQNPIQPPPGHHANRQRRMPKQQPSPKVDPKRNRSPSEQFQQHWEQQEKQLGGRYHPYVPRVHARNRSMSAAGSSDGQTAPGVPYRILHSYNSPAYRNAPIWG